uniref:Uncharacterized protein n=1 Tax=Rhizophora mucronata TaxID=61149 RepID=A0A2P2QZ60_RHIMU
MSFAFTTIVHLSLPLSLWDTTYVWY